jgi:hypothetical protein
MDDPYSYAMLVTLEGPIRTQIHTHINIRNANHAQIIRIQINPHIRNILGRAQHQFCIASSTQEQAPNITTSSYNHIKGITRRRADKLNWATILLHNVDTMEIYEETISNK